MTLLRLHPPPERPRGSCPWRVQFGDEPEIDAAIDRGAKVVSPADLQTNAHFGMDGGPYDILAHMRTKDHRDDVGDRVLVLEEIQSDWATDLRRMPPRDPKARQELIEDLLSIGYEPNVLDTMSIQNLRNDLKEHADSLIEDNNGVFSTTPEHDRVMAIRNRVRFEDPAISPHIDAPFVGSTKWVEMAMKRALRLAVDEGKVALMWSTGEIQKQRWHYNDLSTDPNSDAGAGKADLYDKMIPAVLKKMTKRYGARIGTGTVSEHPDVPLHRLDITDELREAVREGMPLFALKRATDQDIRKAQSLFFQAKQAKPGERSVGRFDLANPSDDETSRRMVDAIDQLRTEQGRPEHIPNELARAEAKRRLQDDYEGQRLALATTIDNGEPLDSVQTLMAQQIAADQALKAVQSGSDESLLDAIEFQEAYREARASTARALQIARDPLMGKKDRLLEAFGELVTKPSPATQSQLDKVNAQLRRAKDQKRREELIAKRQKILDRMAKNAGKIKQNLEDAGYRPDMITADTLDNDIHVARILRVVSTTNATPLDAVWEFFLSMILSGPLTHAANISGNIVNTASELTVSRFAEVLSNGMLKMVGAGDPEGPALADLKPAYEAMFPAMVQAGQNFVRAYRTEQPVFAADIATARGEATGRETKLEAGEANKAIPGLFGRIVRAPSLTTLLAFDELFKTFVGTVQAHSIAYRHAKAEGHEGSALRDRMAELINDLSSEVWTEALTDAKRAVFQDDPGPIGQAGLYLRKVVPGMRFLIPFVSTPERIFAAGLAKTPLMTFTLLYRAANTGLIKIGAKGPDGVDYTVERRRLVRDSANTMAGWALAALIMWLADLEDEDGLPIITGSTPRDFKARQAHYRTAAPYTIKIGGERYSYRRLEPIAVTLATTLDAAREMKRVQEFEGEDTQAAALEATSRMFESILDQTTDKTFLQGLGDIVEILTEPDRRSGNLAKMTQDLSTSWVPNILKQTLRSADPNIRESRIRKQDDDPFWTKAFAQNWAYRAVPASNIAPPPKVDIWGRPITKGPGGTGAGAFLHRLLSPAQVTGREPMELDLLIWRYNEKVDRGLIGENPNGEPAEKFWPRPVDAHIRREGKTHRLTPSEYHALLTQGGQDAAQQLLAMNLNSDDPTPDDIERIKSVLSAAYKRARDRIWQQRKQNHE